MTTTARNNKAVTALIGLAMVALALVAGAYFGSLTSPDAPAHAVEVETQERCTGFCPGATLSGGSGGNTAAVLPARPSGPRR